MGEGREPTGRGTSNSTQLPKLAPSHPVDWVWSTNTHAVASVLVAMTTPAVASSPAV